MSVRSVCSAVMLGMAVISSVATSPADVDGDAEVEASCGPAPAAEPWQETACLAPGQSIEIQFDIAFEVVDLDFIQSNYHAFSAEALLEGPDQTLTLTMEGPVGSDSLTLATDVVDTIVEGDVVVVDPSVDCIITGDWCWSQDWTIRWTNTGDVPANLLYSHTLGTANVAVLTDVVYY